MNLVFAKEFLESRHLVGTAIGDGFDDGRFSGAIQPGLIGQVGCANGRRPLAFRTMTCRAVLGKQLLPLLGTQRTVA